MSTIRTIYNEEPNFPATDQHPDAVRYKVGDFWVDALDGEPTLDQVEAIRNPPTQVEPAEPIDKLMAFLDANPSIRALLGVG